MDFSSSFLHFLRNNGIQKDYYETAPTDKHEIRLGAHTKALGVAGGREAASIICADNSSLQAVKYLQVEPDCHVLDLCCAPGIKMVLIGEYLGASGSYTGVDVSLRRLYNARSLAKKHMLGNVRLFHCDGSSFDIGPQLALQRGPRSLPPAQPRGQAKALYSSTCYRKFPCELLPQSSYQRVIVDAPCTHDGSTKHIRALFQCAWKKPFAEQHFPNDSGALANTQLSLLTNGLACLAKGGILVYSTCSLSPAQNSSIVRRALKARADCSLLPLPLDGLFDGDKFGIMHPAVHNCGSLYICRLRKY